MSTPLNSAIIIGDTTERKFNTAQQQSKASKIAESFKPSGAPRNNHHHLRSGTPGQYSDTGIFSPHDGQLPFFQANFQSENSELQALHLRRVGLLLLTAASYTSISPRSIARHRRADGVKNNTKTGNKKIRAAVMMDSHAARSVTDHSPKLADSNAIISASPPPPTR